MAFHLTPHQEWQNSEADASLINGRRWDEPAGFSGRGLPPALFRLKEQEKGGERAFPSGYPLLNPEPTFFQNKSCRGNLFPPPTCLIDLLELSFSSLTAPNPQSLCLGSLRKGRQAARVSAFRSLRAARRAGKRGGGGGPAKRRRRPGERALGAKALSGRLAAGAIAASSRRDTIGSCGSSSSELPSRSLESGIDWRWNFQQGDEPPGSLLFLIIIFWGKISTLPLKGKMKTPQLFCRRERLLGRECFAAFSRLLRLL